MTKPPRVSLILLNWNGWKDTIECLESVYQMDYPNYDVIVVDNGSSDNSIEQIKKYAAGEIVVESPFFEYSSLNKPIAVFEVDEHSARNGIFDLNSYEKYNSNRRLIIIKNNDNYGYPGGNNGGIIFALKVFDSDYIYILNNDLVIASDNVSIMVKSFEIKKDAGIVGCIHYDYREPKKIVHAGGEINFKKARTISYVNLNNVYFNNKLVKVPWVSGAAIMVKSEVFNKVGLFNECMFLYWDETEFILRVKNYGFSTYVNITTEVWHKIGKSSQKVKLITLYLDTRNSLYVVKKYGKDSDKIILIFAYLSRRIIRTFFSSVIKYKSISRFFAYIFAILMGTSSRICNDLFFVYLKKSKMN
ncbi:glycosyl transferase, group 2 family protein [Aciduliprofundum boonei T469]|nr:glycosyl transferase, group 2 family protein [Aciduliprofundum boonei T469]